MSHGRNISLVIISGVLFLASAGFAARYLYVDPVNGNDNWDGTAATFQISGIGPKKTLPAAQTKVRQWIAAGLNDDVVVELRTGRYELTSPLVFNNQDAHSTYNITWRNYNGEDARISGGKKITTAWSWDSAKGLYATYIPEVASGSWWFRELYRNEQRLVRSRWPNAPTDAMMMSWDFDARRPNDANLLTITAVRGDKKQHTLNAAPPASLAAADRAELVSFWHWTGSKTQISSSSGATMNLSEATGCGGIQPDVNDKAFLENSWTFIDQDNEWALTSTGYLYYRGADPAGFEFVAPRTENLITVEGASATNRVKNLKFQGLTFEYAHFKYLVNDLSLRPLQAGVHCYGTHAKAAVRFANTQNCTFENNTIARCSGAGIHLDTGSYNDQVYRNTIYDIGNSGIVVGNIGEQFTSPIRTADAVVKNNRIYRCAQQYYDAVGIGAFYMYNAVIEHNELYDLPYSGISVGWHWTTDLSNDQNIKVRYNYVHDVMRFMEDGGGIYLLSDLTGSEVSHNLIQRVGYNGQACMGIYADEGASNFIVHGNVIDEVYSGWSYLMHRWNHNNQVLNNIFIDGGKGELHRNQNTPPPSEFVGFSVNLQRNIVVQSSVSDSYTTSNAGNWDYPSQYDTDYNCYYNPANPTKTFAGHSWSYWKATLGNDLNSYYQQNPMFEDDTHAGQNYRLQSGSPLLGAPMNFQQVLVQNAGVEPVVVESLVYRFNEWKGVSSDWRNPANWFNPDTGLVRNAVPDSDADVIITGIPNNGNLSVCDLAGSPAGQGNTCYVGCWGAGEATLTLNANLHIQTRNNGKWNDGRLIIGSQTGATGTMTINGGQLDVDAQLVVGWDGSGTMNINGGVVNVGNNVPAGGWASLILAEGTSTTGHIEMAGGEIHTPHLDCRSAGTISFSGNAKIIVHNTYQLSEIQGWIASGQIANTLVTEVNGTIEIASKCNTIYVGDIDNNCVVNLLDFMILADNWLRTGYSLN